MEGGRKERMADGESERVSAGLVGLVSSHVRRIKRACRRAGVVLRGGSGRGRRGLQQRGAGGEAWRNFYRKCCDPVKKKTPDPFSFPRSLRDGRPLFLSLRG